MSKVPPLKRSYDPINPFVIERESREDGGFAYHIWDTRPESAHPICVISEEYVDVDMEIVEDRARVKKDADMIVTALNRIYGSRPFQSAQLRTFIPPRTSK